MFSYVIIFILIVIIIILASYFVNSKHLWVQVYRGRGEESIENGDIIKDLKKHPRSRSEAYAISVLEKLTNARFPTVYPKWLHARDGAKLELDGYNAALKLAIEFQGPLHYKWFNNKEPYEKYLERIERDELKARLCAENGVRLIVLDAKLPHWHTHNYINSRLFDFGLIPDKPAQYIRAEKIEPWRKGD